MTILLDTNVIIDVLNKRKDRRGFLDGLVSQNYVLASCAVTVAEVYAGMRPNEVSVTTTFFSELEFYPATEATARRAGDLKAVWKKKGRSIELPDALIAAVALEHGLMLATDNTKHFPMPELQLLPLPQSH